MLYHLVGFRHRVVVEHLRGKRDAGNRRLQLMRHVVDEIIFHLTVALLPEADHYREDESYYQNEREHNARYHEADTGEDIAVDVGKMNAQHTHPRGRLVAVERLGIGKLRPLIAVIGATVNLTAVLRAYGEVIRDINAVVDELCLDVLIEDAEIDTLLQRFVGRRIEHVHHHLVEQGTLIDITVLHEFLQRAAGGIVGAGVIAQDHGLGNVHRLVGHRLQLERDKLLAACGSASGISIRCHLAAVPARA